MRRRTRSSKSSISKAGSYAEIGKFWDNQDLSHFWKKTRKVKFDVVLGPGNDALRRRKGLSEKIQAD